MRQIMPLPSAGLGNKLDGVHPELEDKILNVLSAMEALGFPMFVFEGIRSQKRQEELYAQGRSKPGNIVTHINGVTKKSNHQAKEDGFGYAVDCVFVENGKPSWSLNSPWKLYGECVKSQGLKWGGDFKRLVDYPHAEL